MLLFFVTINQKRNAIKQNNVTTNPEKYDISVH